MPVTPWIPTITNIKDGTDVSAEVVNPILAQHTQREQHLFEQLAAFTDKSVLTIFNEPLFPRSPINVRKN